MERPPSQPSPFGKLRAGPWGKEHQTKPFPPALLCRSGYAKAKGETGKGVN